jgi:hypothetical protein
MLSMEVQHMPIFPIDSGSNEALVKGQLTRWLEEADVSNLLNIDVSSLEVQSVPTKNAEADYFCMPDSPFTSSPYSSPELPEMESSFVSDAPPLFEDQLIDVDAMIFDNSFTVSPEVLPELEKILSAVEHTISPPTSPDSQTNDCVPDTSSRASKKRKGDDGKECEASIFLPRNQLLTMTSTEIEDYVIKIKAQRTLTASEEKELKRQRRLIKNREYASQSRSRKKQYVDELEKTIEAVRVENASLKQQVSSLNDENKTLKRQIVAIATKIKKSVPATPANASGGVFTKLTSVGGRSTNNVKMISTCLMAIMFMVFTFGIFWDHPQPVQLLPSTPMMRVIRQLKDSDTTEQLIPAMPLKLNGLYLVSEPNLLMHTYSNLSDWCPYQTMGDVPS